MSAALHLARPDDLPKLTPLLAAFAKEEGLNTAPELREAALMPLLEGSPHGAVYIIGPRQGPIGYLVVCFGWSLEFGGMDGFVDEIFLRPTIRGRGIATEVLLGLGRALSEAGVKALHLEVRPENKAAVRLYERTGFTMREGYRLMTRVF